MLVRMLAIAMSAYVTATGAIRQSGLYDGRWDC